MKEELLRVLEAQKSGLTYIEIYNLLKLEEVSDFKEMQDELDKLVSEGKVHRSRKDKFILMEKCSSLVSGYIKINKSGNGYILVPNGPDIFVDKMNLNGAIDGDLVEADTSSGEGIITNILKRDLSNVVGELVSRNGELEFIPDDKKKEVHFKITATSIAHCVEGQKVVVNKVKELKNNLYLGEIVKVLGHKNDPGIDIRTKAAEYNIYNEFSEASIEQVKTMPTFVSESEKKGRKDLTKETIFTIDGDDTKDIDDAISIKKDGDNYILSVHIADVSYYVKEGTPLFQDALSKGNSSYLADTVFPMLMHELSNGICSLNEGVDRLAITCEMTINPKGKIIDHDIYPSVIKSKKKMTYKNVNKILMEDKVPEGYEEYVDDLKTMKSLADILRKNKVQRGYIDFDLDEGKIVQDEEGKAIDVVAREQLAGEKLIEDFMIAANETVAAHIYHMGLPFLYRIHGEPSPEKIENFMRLLKILHIKIDVNINEITPHTIQKILDSLRDHPKFPVLSAILLRSMRKAEYSAENIGHFGIASMIYTHFTSPIRRFCDLMVHTLIRKYLFEGKNDLETYEYYENVLPTYAKAASDREVDSVEAERDVFDMKCAEYMLDNLGKEYEGIITGITKFGFYVQLPNLIEGLVHIRTLDGRYQPDEYFLTMGCPGRRTYTLGDKVRVVATAANKDTATIDFCLSNTRINTISTEQKERKRHGN